jgi:hypothetical protein
VPAHPIPRWQSSGAPLIDEIYALADDDGSNGGERFWMQSRKRDRRGLRESAPTGWGTPNGINAF